MSDLKIYLKEYITEEDYRKIEQLKNICIEKEEMYLKLELDFKLNLSKIHKGEILENTNEFFCYSGETLIGYLGICNFGGEAGEVTGMVHPLYRRKGVFNRLYTLAKEECKRRDFKKILLICDNMTFSGLKFIESTGAVYSFSEYEMKLDNNYISEQGKNIVLRKALNLDAEEIARQNSIYFASTGGTVIMPEEEEKRNRITYMIELGSKIIGKIRVEVNDNEGFISGFGILPEYRGKGYGKEALNAALYILSKNNIHSAALEVAAKNKNALNLYKSCGFVEKGIMDYYVSVKNSPCGFLKTSLIN